MKSGRSIFVVAGSVMAFALMALAPLASQAQEANVSGASGGDVRTASPRIMDPARPGYFQIGVGPSFAMGLNADSVMYDINAAYNYNFSDRFAGKAFGDLNMGSGSETARMSVLGIGGDVYLQEARVGYGIPYATADLGYGFSRNSKDQTKDAATVGVGTGFKFATEALNLDANIHYTLLTAQLDGKTPSVFGLRVAVAF